MSPPNPDSALWLALTALGSWRVTTFLCFEEGPLRVAVRLRRLLAQVGLARVILCFHCSAFWISAVFVSALYEWTARTPLLVLGVSGAVSIAERCLSPGGAEVTGDE